MPPIISFTFSVVDSKGAVSFVALYSAIDEWDFTVTELNLAANDMLPLIRNLLTGGTPRCRISIDADFGTLFSSFPGIQYPSATDSDVEEGATLIFRMDEGIPVDFRLATFDENLFFAGTREVDAADPRMTAFVTLILGGVHLGGGRVLSFTDSRGGFLWYFENGSETFKRRKNKRRPRS